ncbi:hypothetical protein [Spiroplasma mirum]|uniref:hypothetical protein n=1 Tax=Spiroplasma mirum TaxID=2144 RepID=UPI000655079D|nr:MULTISPECIES: hypothetical protein [Spiroplasma]AKM52697.1 hypothetical protein SATRI_v1c01150 [Spiroplasma atrichopogonis]
MIENVTIIIIIVKNAPIPNSGCNYSISLIWTIISVPTKIVAAHAMAGVINLKIGNNTIEIKNNVPITNDENPLRAPWETPVVDST